MSSRSNQKRLRGTLSIRRSRSRMAKNRSANVNNKPSKKPSRWSGKKRSLRVMNDAKPSEKKSNNMSALQLDMMKRLEGSRFRMLNEQLYTTSGEEAFHTFQNEPDLFDIYHRGFREQVLKWPVNPLDRMIQYIRKCPKAIVADFGCGDAKLAASLSNQVHSFDLVANQPNVVACNMAHVPLEDASIDIAVFCLALMGTTVTEYLVEAHRVLKQSGILKIAEVKSRFETTQTGGIPGFLQAMKRLGFDLVNKDESNKMFVLLDFRKTKRRPTANVVIQLKACEYKRR